MKLMLEKIITYFAFNFNDASYTAIVQSIDSVTSKIFSWIGRLGGIFISPNICLLDAIFSTRITSNNEDITDLTNLILS